MSSAIIQSENSDGEEKWNSDDPPGSLDKDVGSTKILMEADEMADEEMFGGSKPGNEEGEESPEKSNLAAGDNVPSVTIGSETQSDSKPIDTKATAKAGKDPKKQTLILRNTKDSNAPKLEVYEDPNGTIKIGKKTFSILRTIDSSPTKAVEQTTKSSEEAKKANESTDTPRRPTRRGVKEELESEEKEKKLILEITDKGARKTTKVSKEEDNIVVLQEEGANNETQIVVIVNDEFPSSSRSKRVKREARESPDESDSESFTAEPKKRMKRKADLSPDAFEQSMDSSEKSFTKRAKGENEDATPRTHKAKEYPDYFHWLTFYLKKGRFPDGIPEDCRRNIPRNATKFVIDDDSGELMYDDPKLGLRLVCKTPEERQAALIECHDDKGHGGMDKTLKHLSASYYWHNTVESVRKHIDNCEECSARKPYQSTKQKSIDNKRALESWPKRGDWENMPKYTDDSREFPDDNTSVLLGAEDEDKDDKDENEGDGEESTWVYKHRRVDFMHVLHLLKTGKPPEGLGTVPTCTLTRAARRSFVYDDERDVLYYMDQNRQILRMVCITEAEKRYALTECHDNLGHMKVHKVLESLNKKYYWFSTKEDTLRWIQGCNYCNEMKMIPAPPPQRPNPPVPSNGPWDSIIFDFFEPIKYQDTPRGYRYLASVTDTYSRFVILEPMEDNTESHLIKTIETVLYRHGLPQLLVMPKFTIMQKQPMVDALARLNVKVNWLTRYFESCKNEKNANLQPNLDELIKTKKTDWDLYLQCVAYGINTSIEPFAMVSPYELMYGRQPNDPGAIMTDSRVVDENDEEVSPAVACRARVLSLLISHDEVIEGARSVEKYEKPNHNFNVGSQVAVRKKVPNTNKCIFEGPFTVLGLSRTRVKLCNNSWVPFTALRKAEEVTVGLATSKPQRTGIRRRKVDMMKQENQSYLTDEPSLVGDEENYRAEDSDEDPPYDPPSSTRTPRGRASKRLERKPKLDVAKLLSSADTIWS